ncbi:hypothetical protein COLO4_04204 [Corchorus olitorius]|uniref:Uncharacterized protein n=1 Tax=Corchorus olitorius TaxID=93759 RepID=A0A1R3KUV2_9ROSI|nr:hypothetical protein COLO4_04204 [Corchorus olitorius]
MAVSRGMIVFCFMTLIFCSLLVKVSKADHETAEECARAHPDDSQRCADSFHEDDDFDDTYKVVNNMKISSEMLVIGH